MEKFSLKVFRTVAEHLSFRKAAELLFLTQPAVSLQIKALEEELGVRLFDRAAGKVSLTKQGAILLPHAQKLASIALEAAQELSDNEVQLSGVFALGVSTTIAQYVLPRFLAIFLAEHPRLKLSVHSANTDAIVRLLLDGKVSIGLIAGPTQQGGLHAEPFMADELVLIASPDFEFSHVSHGQLTAETLLLREPGSGSRRVVEAALKKSHLKLNLFKNVIELDSTEAIKSAAEAGLGVGFVSHCAINKELELQSLKLVEVDGVRITRHYSVVSLTGPEPSGAAGAFRTFAIDRARHLSKVAWKSTRTYMVER
ncbi:MAG TPA: LysR substrate-binding domain-containing protein [Candidatus Saccharimonadales bacterium]|nr:LysR substrate-binding domain-containing protein [Candidatus Saccharimonadales bacterium]